MKKIYFLILTILIISCEKQEIVIDTHQKDLKFIQNQFSLSDFKDEYVKNNLVVNWNDFRKNNEEVTVFTFSTNLASKLESDKNSLSYKYHLSANQIEGEWNFNLVKIVAADKVELKNATLESSEKFTGTQSTYDLTGEIIEIKAFEEGKVVSEFNKELLARNQYKYAPPIGPGTCTGCGWVAIRTERWMDYWNIGTDSEGNLVSLYYRGSSLRSIVTEWVYVPNAGGYNDGFGDYVGGNSYHEHYNYQPHGPAINENPHDYEYEAEIINVNRTESFKNNEKVNCTYERIMEEGTIQEALRDFFGEDAPYDLTYNVVEDLNCNDKPNASGCTTQLNDGTYRIDLDKTYINDPKTPTIFLAQTLIHESFHAKLFVEVLKIDSSVTSDTKFEELYEKYRLHENWSHQVMAEYYTKMMQTALKEVHSQLNDSKFLNYYDDNTLWDWNEFYEYVSYRGLDETVAGKAYFANAENVSLYESGAEVNSTKIPNCNE